MADPSTVRSGKINTGTCCCRKYIEPRTKQRQPSKTDSVRNCHKATLAKINGAKVRRSWLNICEKTTQRTQVMPTGRASDHATPRNDRLYRFLKSLQTNDH